VEIASDKQAVNIVLLDVRSLCSFADYFVICTGDSQRQVRTILEDIELTLKREHIFSPGERDYYNLDGLWNKAVPVLRIQ
jgi:ribosome-associated protein